MTPRHEKGIEPTTPERKAGSHKPCHQADHSYTEGIDSEL